MCETCQEQFEEHIFIICVKDEKNKDFILNHSQSISNLLWDYNILSLVSYL